MSVDIMHVSEIPITRAPDDVWGNVCKYCDSHTIQMLRRSGPQFYASPSICAHFKTLRISGLDGPSCIVERLRHFPGGNHLRRLTLTGLRPADFQDLLHSGKDDDGVRRTLSGVTHLEIVVDCVSHGLISELISRLLLTAFPRFTDGTAATTLSLSPVIAPFMDEIVGHGPTISETTSSSLTVHTLVLIKSCVRLATLPNLRILSLKHVYNIDDLVEQLPRLVSLKVLYLDVFQILPVYGYSTRHLASHSLRELHVDWSTNAPALDLSQCRQLTRICLRGLHVPLNPRRTLGEEEHSVSWMCPRECRRDLSFEVLRIGGEDGSESECDRRFYLDVDYDGSWVLDPSSPLRFRGSVVDDVKQIMACLAPVLRGTADAVEGSLNTVIDARAFLALMSQLFDGRRLREILFHRSGVPLQNTGDVSMVHLMRILPKMEKLMFVVSVQYDFPKDLSAALRQAKAERRPLHIHLECACQYEVELDEHVACVERQLQGLRMFERERQPEGLRTFESNEDDARFTWTPCCF